MKHFFILSLLLFIVTSSVSTSEEVIKNNEFYKLDGLIFKNFSSKPYNGEIHFYEKIGNKKVLLGLEKIKEGKRVYKEHFFTNGHLRFKRFYEDGILADGEYVEYHSNGLILTEFTVKNGKLKGRKNYFYRDGSLDRFFELKDDRTVIENRFFSNGKLERITEGKINTDVYLNPTIDFYNDRVWENAEYKIVAYHSNGHLHWRGNYLNNVKEGYFDSYYINNGILSVRSYYKNGKQLKPFFHPTLIFNKFPLCSFKTSKGNICKYLEKSEKDNYSFHSFLEKENIQKTKEYFSHFKTDDWNYFFSVSMDEEDNILLHFTDDGISGTYFVTKTYGITYSEEKENWVINSETINYLDGSKEDKKIEGKVTKFDPPIPFIECVEFNQNGLCLE
jgi:antitoxin component YwqK of YwqJK toxin-antitoxin module